MIPTGILGRLFTRSHILPPTYPIGPQVVVLMFPRRTFSMSYPASLHKELHVRLQQSLVLSLGVICGLRLYFRLYLFSRVCFVTDPRGSTLYILVYVLVVTSGLTSADVSPTSGLRSPDKTDEDEGSITCLRLV